MGANISPVNSRVANLSASGKPDGAPSLRPSPPSRRLLLWPAAYSWAFVKSRCSIPRPSLCPTCTSQPSPSPPFVSGHDEDGDGIDDQTDVLQSAEAYVARGPEYKSIYYAETSYPTDEFGVCTDVIAQALRGADYDLMTLLDTDVRANPETYGIDEPDAAIDFRRVRNQKVYFDRHAVSLRCDTSDPSQWQGGDIVAYNEHVGIASSRRNAKGLPTSSTTTAPPRHPTRKTPWKPGAPSSATIAYRIEKIRPPHGRDAAG